LPHQRIKISSALLAITLVVANDTHESAFIRDTVNGGNEGGTGLDRSGHLINREPHKRVQLDTEFHHGDNVVVDNDRALVKEQIVKLARQGVSVNLESEILGSFRPTTMDTEGIWDIHHARLHNAGGYRAHHHHHHDKKAAGENHIGKSEKTDLSSLLDTDDKQTRQCPK
jgi:hypothetical protein